MKAIGPKLVIATHNDGKLREIRDLLAPFGIECVGAAELDLPEPEETGITFVDNAELKARAGGRSVGPAGAGRRQRAQRRRAPRPPGNLLARAGPRTRRATATSAGRWSACGARSRPPAPTPGTTRISSARCRSPGPTATSKASKARSTARWCGRRAATTASAMTRCSSPTGMDQTFGEIEPAEKHAVSHRAQAFAKLVAALG